MFELTIHQVFNYCEFAVWEIAAVISVFLMRRRRGRTRMQLILAAVAFAVFGVSDLIEVRTGTWARPWWLLVMNAACLAVLLPLLVVYLRSRRKVLQDR
ncbi:MAG: hypothetical protein ABIG44_17145 [Planctomycetota bacterium]